MPIIKKSKIVRFLFLIYARKSQSIRRFLRKIAVIIGNGYPVATAAIALTAKRRERIMVAIKSIRSAPRLLR